MAAPRANRAKAELFALAAQHGGRLSPRAVVDAARDPASVLHSRFEWDDSAAAEGFRLVQAQGLLRSVKIRVVVESRDPTRVDLVVQRGFPSPPRLRSAGGSSYIALPSATPADIDSLVEDVLAQLERLRAKHGHLTKLDGVWKAIDEAGDR